MWSSSPMTELILLRLSFGIHETCCPFIFCLKQPLLRSFITTTIKIIYLFNLRFQHLKPSKWSYDIHLLYRCVHRNARSGLLLVKRASVWTNITYPILWTNIMDVIFPSSMSNIFRKKWNAHESSTFEILNNMFKLLNTSANPCHKLMCHL